MWENKSGRKSLRLFLEETIQKKRVTLQQIWQKKMHDHTSTTHHHFRSTINYCNQLEARSRAWSLKQKKHHHHPAQFLQSFVKTFQQKISSIWRFSIWLPVFFTAAQKITTKNIFIVHTSKPYPVLVTNLVWIQCSVKYIPSLSRKNFILHFFKTF